jgi:NADP-dependent 3-hydroxy acid dehydrogenase YdfG
MSAVHASNLPLNGRVAVVTGAASGIGAATARRLVEDGARAALIARRADRLHALVDELDGERALAVTADVTKPAQLDDAAAAIDDRFGFADLIVANAGVMLAAPVEGLRGDDWRQMIDVNLVGVLETVRAFLPGLLKAADQSGVADLMLVSSIGARMTVPGYAIYGATKAAVSYLASAWREELSPRGVRVSAIEPGMTQSELADNVTHPDLARELQGMFEQIRALNASDVADLVAYIAGLPAHVSMPTAPVLPSQQV